MRHSGGVVVVVELEFEFFAALSAFLELEGLFAGAYFAGSGFSGGEAGGEGDGELGGGGVGGGAGEFLNDGAEVGGVGLDEGGGGGCGGVGRWSGVEGAGIYW